LAAAILMVTAIFISAAGTHRLIPWLRKPPVENRNLRQLAGDMVATLRHRSFLMMLGVGVFAAMGQGIGFTLNPYFVNYFWHLTPPQLSTLIIQAGVGAFGSTIVAAFVSRALGKKRAAMTLMASSVLIGAVPMTLRLFGLMPPNSTWELTWVLFAFGCVTSPMGIGASILVSSMIADVVEDSELRTGKRSEGLFFSAAAFRQQGHLGHGRSGRRADPVRHRLPAACRARPCRRAGPAQPGPALHSGDHRPLRRRDHLHEFLQDLQDHPRGQPAQAGGG
jgi:GPH family glycoside/pentoside/hexuronide:cation symporter